MIPVSNKKNRTLNWGYQMMILLSAESGGADLDTHMWDDQHQSWWCQRCAKKVDISTPLEILENVRGCDLSLLIPVWDVLSKSNWEASKSGDCTRITHPTKGKTNATCWTGQSKSVMLDSSHGSLLYPQQCRKMAFCKLHPNLWTWTT